MSGRIRTRQLHFTAVFLLTSLCFAGYFLFLAATLKVPVLEVVHPLFRSLYLPNFNIFRTTPVGGILPFILMYEIFVMVACAVILFCLLARRPVPIRKTLTATAVSLLLLSAGCQQIARVRSFIKEFGTFSRIRPEDRYGLFFPQMNAFAHAVLSKAQRKYRCRFVSGVERNEPYWVVHAFLKFTWYPVVTFLPPEAGESADAVLLYDVQDPWRHVPEGFVILERSPDMKYILAVEQP